MKYLKVLVILSVTLNLCLSSCKSKQSNSTQGIEFFNGSFLEAKVKAEKSNKLIFVDAYTTWCGPCKQMSSKVFTDSKVGAYFNQNFICMKIDMETDAGYKFQEKYQVEAYPKLFFIKHDGSIAQAVLGYHGVDELLNIAKKLKN